MNSVQENDRGWYMCQVRSTQSKKSVKYLIKPFSHNDQPLFPPDQHGSNGSQVGLKNDFSHCETNSHRLTNSDQAK